MVVSVCIALCLVLYVWLNNPAMDSVAKSSTEIATAPVVASDKSESTLPILTKESDLVRRDADPRLISFTCPDEVFCSAYDPETGKLGIMIPNRGIYFYKIEDLSEGNGRSCKIIQTRGEPRSLCAKNFNGERIFVYADGESAGLTILSAETLDVKKCIPLERAEEAMYFQTSEDPNDRFLYFKTRGDFVRRINLDSGEASQSQITIDDIRLSIDGKKLNQGVWHFLGDRIVNGEFVYDEVASAIALPNPISDRGYLVASQHAEFSPQCLIASRGVAVGNQGNELVFGSQNSLTQFLSIPLPILRAHEKRTPHVDTRIPERLNSTGDSNYFALNVDESKRVVICCSDWQVSIARLDKIQLPERIEPIQPPALPKSLVVGNRVPLPLKLDDGTNAELLLGAKGMPLEHEASVRVVGPSPSEGNGQLWDQLAAGSTVLPAIDRGKLPTPPFSIRIGSELIRCQLGKQKETILERGGKYYHRKGSRVHLVDESEEAKNQQSNEVIGRLEASLNPDQDVIIPEDLYEFGKKEFPYPIMVGDEIMTALGTNEPRGFLKVKRETPIAHSAQQDICLLNRLPSEFPSIQQGALKWTPKESEIGYQYVRLRIKRGDDFIDVIRSVDVINDSSEIELPFFARSVHTRPGLDKAVIWGVEKSQATSPEKPSSHLAVVDLKSSKVVAHLSDQFEVTHAICDATGIYAFTRVLQDSQVNQWNNYLRRFDPKTLNEIAKRKLTNLPEGLQAFSSKYMLVGDGEILAIPSLVPIGDRSNHFGLYGESGDGVVKNGVLWDHAVTEEKLLLHVPAMGESKRTLTTDWGTTQVELSGRDLFSWHSRFTLPITKGFRMRNRDVALAASKAMLLARPWNPLANGEMLNLSEIPFGDSDERKQFVNAPPTRPVDFELSTDSIAEADGVILVASKATGRLYSIPTQRIPSPPNASIRFVPFQSTMLLDVRKPTLVRYQATGASQYRLKLWLEFPPQTTHSDQRSIQPLTQGELFSLESSDGQFEIKLDPAVLGRYAIEASKRHFSLEMYSLRVRKDIREQVGLETNGVPIILTALVEAKETNSANCTGMIHCYVAVLPTKYVIELLSAENNQGPK